jgi:hypothetical protein
MGKTRKGTRRRKFWSRPFFSPTVSDSTWRLTASCTENNSQVGRRYERCIIPKQGSGLNNSLHSSSSPSPTRCSPFTATSRLLRRPPHCPPASRYHPLPTLLPLSLKVPLESAPAPYFITLTMNPHEWGSTDSFHLSTPAHVFFSTTAPVEKMTD